MKRYYHEVKNGIMTEFIQNSISFEQWRNLVNKSLAHSLVWSYRQLNRSNHDVKMNRIMTSCVAHLKHVKISEVDLLLT